MLKQIEDSAFIGRVLFFSALVLGIMFRVLGLEAIGPWGDELASWYYAQNLSQVILFESHTPLYYSLIRVWAFFFTDTIISLRYFSIFSGLLILMYCSYFISKKYDKKIGLLLFTTWWLWPTMIIYDRQARHYGLYASLTLLVLITWSFRKDFKKWFVWGLLALYQGLHPLAVIVTFFLFLKDFFHHKSFKRLLFDASSALPVLLYYAYRFFTWGKRHVISNVEWNNSDILTFFKSLLYLFAGDSYPFSLKNPVEFSWLLYLGSCLVIVFFLTKNYKQNFKTFILSFVSLLVLTIALVEMLALLGINLRLGRYFIFLPAFLLYYLVISAHSWGKREIEVKLVVMLLSLSIFVAFFQKPWSYYSWDEQIVESFRNDFNNELTKDLVICANPFQLAYYFGKPYSKCADVALRYYREGRDFFFFDLNGNDRFVALYLIENMSVDEYKLYGHGLFLSLTQKRN